MAANTFHNAGVIQFGPDGKLYVVTGDAGDKTLAQDLNSLQGKVLRLNKRGRVPDDNPFGDSLIFSYGHRNGYGFTFDPLDPKPDSVEVWEVENGPTCNDEINKVRAGKNYGWGEEESCPDTNQSGSNPIQPLYIWESPVALLVQYFVIAVV